MDDIASARRRSSDPRTPQREGQSGPVGITPPARSGASLTPKVGELQAIRDRLLEDVEAMTARIAEIESLAGEAAEEQRRRAAEEERQRRERWAELERLAAARPERQALPRPESEVVGPAPGAPAVVEEQQPRRERRGERVIAAALAGLLVGAAVTAGVAAAVDDGGTSSSPARPAAAAAAKPAAKQVPLCSEVASDADVTCDTGTRLFIAGQGSPARLGPLEARVVETKLEGATAAVAVQLTAARDEQLTTDPDRLYLSIGGRRFPAAALNPIVLSAGDKQTVTFQFLLDQPALDKLSAGEGDADLGMVPPGVDPGTRLGVLRVNLKP